MIKKTIVIMLALILLVSIVGCSNKQKEIDELKAQIEELQKEQEVSKVQQKSNQEKEAAAPKLTTELPKMPQYIVEGDYGRCLYVTVIPPYTEEGLLLIIEEEKLGRDSFMFFLPNAPRFKVDPDNTLSTSLPEDDYCIASYIYYEKEDEWMKIK